MPLDSHYQYDFTCPVKTNAGHRALEHLPFELKAFNAVKPLVITGKAMAGRGLVDTVSAAFKDSGMTIGVYDGVPEKPDALLIRELSAIYRDKGFDSVIVLGGGSIADAAKVLNIVVSGAPEDLANAAGEDRVSGPLNPLFMVLAGPMDGCEVSRYAELAGKEYVSRHLMPDLVVLDPRMMSKQPFAVTAASMIVTLTQAVDAYWGAYRNPLTDAYAYGALRMILKNIPPIIHNPEDRLARLALVNAACLAGYAFSNMPRGMAYELGRAAASAGNLSPGFCMGAVLPYSLSFYQRTYGARTDCDLSPFCDLDIHDGGPGTHPEGEAADVLRQLLNRIRQAGAGYQSLTEAKLPESALTETAQKAASKDYSEDACLAVLKKAWTGIMEP